MIKSELPLATKNMRIGLLGGSFNPAHKGHVHISVEAIKKLKLSEVWWLVSPQNPLKNTSETKSLTERITQARKIITHPSIRVTKLETILGTQYTVDTLKGVRKRYPMGNFVWLMGADNLENFDKWKKWPDIFKIMPIAILDRPDYGIKVLSSKPAQRFKQYRIDTEDAASLATNKAPSWCYIPLKLDFTSSTQIRAKLKARKNG